MAEESARGQPPRGSIRDLVRRSWSALRLRLDGLAVTILVGASSLLGLDAFGMLLSLWPVFPTLVPLLLLASAIAYGIVRLARWRRRGRDDDPPTDDEHPR